MLIPRSMRHLGFDVICRGFDASSGVHLRSSSRGLPDKSCLPFPYRSAPGRCRRSTVRWFEGCSCKPPSGSQGSVEPFPISCKALLGTPHPPEMVYSKCKSPNTGVLRRFLSRIVEQMSTALALRASRAPLPRSRPFFCTYFSQNHRVCPLQGRFLVERGIFNLR